MNQNLYILSGNKILNMALVRHVDKNGTSNLTVNWADGTQDVFADAGNAVYNKIVAASN